MINEQRSGGLIAPRRRTEHETPATEQPGTSGVPVISRLPSLAPVQPSPASAAADVADVVEQRTGAATEPPVVEVRKAESDSATMLGVAGDRGEEHRQLSAAITTFPWNNLLLGLGLAGLLVLAVLAATRSRPAVVAPPTPPTVHYHITPPQAASTVADAASSAISSAFGPSLSTTESMLASEVFEDDQPRIARHEVEDAAARALSLEGAPNKRQDVGSDDPASDSAGAYPATEFPDLPLPPPRTSHGPSTSGARLTGNIEKFKK